MFKNFFFANAEMGIKIINSVSGKFIISVLFFSQEMPKLEQLAQFIDKIYPSN